MLKLAAIGDSLTQGFQSGAICNTHLSYPALVARGMELNDFRYPDFTGASGLPVNIEAILRHYDEKIEEASLRSFVYLVSSIRHRMDQIEDYWERHEGSRMTNTGPVHHNVAVWGFAIEDSWLVTPAYCRHYSEQNEDAWFDQIPKWPMYRTAVRTLNPTYRSGFEHHSQLDALRHLSREHDGIENLIVWLGNNNCLGTVMGLDVRQTEEADLNKAPHERRGNLWRPEHFAKSYARLTEEIASVGAENVYVANIPKVTIPPVSRGVNSKPGTDPDEDGYFDCYTHFWVWDDDFRSNPEDYPHLHKVDVKRIDRTIESYNEVIRGVVTTRGWKLVDIASLLDSLAFRRARGNVNQTIPPGLADAIGRDKRARTVLGERDPVLDTRYLRSDPSGCITHGGLFSLDGIHPTTMANGIIASEFLKVIGETVERKLEPSDAWWDFVVENDSLLRSPPKCLEELKTLLRQIASSKTFGILLKLFDYVGLDDE